MWGEFWQREGTAHCRESSGAGFMGKGGSKPGPTGQTGSQQASQEGRGRGAGQAKRQGFWKPLQRGEAQEAGAFTGAPPPLTGAPATPNSTDTLCLAQLPLYPGMPPTQITYDPMSLSAGVSSSRQPSSSVSGLTTIHSLAPAQVRGRGRMSLFLA